MCRSISPVSCFLLLLPHRGIAVSLAPPSVLLSGPWTTASLSCPLLRPGINPPPCGVNYVSGLFCKPCPACTARSAPAAEAQSWPRRLSCYQVTPFIQPHNRQALPIRSPFPFVSRSPPRPRQHAERHEEPAGRPHPPAPFHQGLTTFSVADLPRYI